MKTIITLCVGLLVSGCATFQSIATRAKPVVDHYCMQDPALREITRLEVNMAIAPHTIRIDCSNDE